MDTTHRQEGPRLAALRQTLNYAKTESDKLSVAIYHFSELEDELIAAREENARIERIQDRLASTEAALYELARVVGSRRGTPHEL